MEDNFLYRQPTGWRDGGVNILLGIVVIYISLELNARASVYVGAFCVIYGISDILPESQKVVSSFIRICALIITISLIIATWQQVFLKDLSDHMIRYFEGHVLKPPVFLRIDHKQLPRR
jgi:uncharacterized membrane protein HdeD (DUF308 family)